MLRHTLIWSNLLLLKFIILAISYFILYLQAMKRVIYTIILLLSIAFSARPQDNPSFTPESSLEKSESDPCIVQEVKTYAWQLSPNVYSRYAVDQDTVFLDYYRTDIEDSYSTSYNYLGNFGSPGQSRIFMDRRQAPDFMFLQAYERYNVTPTTRKFYNTQIPFTQVSYLTGGSKPNAEDRLMGTFGANVNKKLGFGAALDYIYARGFYEFQGVKNLSWQIFGSYISDKYEAHAMVNMENFSNQENGGISDPEYILKPENISSNLRDPKNIPTNLLDAWNRVKNKEVFFTQRYNVGFDRDFYKAQDDSTLYTEFVPVTSFVHTFQFNSNYRKFIIEQGGIQTDGFYPNSYINSTETDDSLRYLSVKNTLAITLNEGFSRYSKFGLAAFATLENRKYTNMQDTLDMGYIARHYRTDILWVGGELSKTKGSILTYNAQGKVALTGYNIGDIDITGAIQTKIPLFKDSIIVQADGYFKNSEANYYMRRFFTNHFRWKNNFDKEQRYRVAGNLIIPFTRTRLSAGVENITNYLYFDDESLPQQYGGNIQIFSAALDQDFKFGILNWKNSVTFQKSSSSVIALPDIAAYSQLYLNFTIAGVLKTQLGVDCNYFTKYYAPMYQPATQMFHNQEIEKVGNYPLMNVFANCKLKQVRFFVMMYHVNKGLFGSNEYFSAPYYPFNPGVFKLGVSIDFNN